MDNKIANTAILIAAVTLISRLTGFIRDVMLASSYGTSLNSDAFIMAQSIISVITALALAALGTTFIPVMSDYLAHKPKEEINKFLNAVYTVSVSVTMIVCILGMIFTESLVRLFAPGFTAEATALTVQLIMIMLPAIVLTAFVTLNGVKLQTHNRYLIPATAGLPINLAMIAALLLFTDSYGIQGLAVSFIIGIILQIALQLPFTHKLGYRYKINFNLKDEGLRRIGLLIIPILIGTGIRQIDTIIDRILASGLVQGTVAALTFSNKLSVFIIGLLSTTVASIFYTSMSNYYSTGKDILFKKLLKNMINVCILLIIPASIIFMVLRLPIVLLVFQRGEFDRAASEMTAVALFYYSIGLIGFLLRDVVSRAFYALKNTKIVMINGSIAVLINTVASIILARYLGIGGLALGTSISGLAGTILLMISLHKKIGDYGILNILITLGKVLAASAVMGVAVYYGFALVYALFSSNFVALMLSILLGGILYVILVSLLKIDEVRSLQRMVMARVRLKGKL